MNRAALLAAIGLTIMLATISAAHAEDANAAWDDFSAHRRDYLRTLSRAVHACEARRDTGHPVFNGCIDWHSSVHGYWALLRAARYTGEQRSIEFVTARLDSPRLAEERDHLNRDKLFEMPYGRAWFLRLAMEYETVTKRNTLRPMADDIARSLQAYYTATPPVPGSGEYLNAEWAFRNLHDYAAFTRNKDLARFVRNSMDHFLAAPFPWSFASDATDHPEFFSRYGNFLHLLEVAADTPTFARVLAAAPTPPAALAPLTEFLNVHHLGMNYSRAWGLWSAYVKTKDTAYREAYRQHVLAGFGEHAAYKDDYHAYGHWVPQFGIYAITCSMGAD